MSTPIKTEDIKKGDHIRKEYPLVGRNFSQTAVEYIAIFDGETSGSNAATYYLLDRPKPAVVLPTEPGHYLDSAGGLWTLHTGREWINNGDGSLASVWTLHEMRHSLQSDLLPFTLLRPVAEVAAEVLAEVQSAVNVRAVPEQGSGRIVVSPANLIDDLRKIAAKWGVTK